MSAAELSENLADVLAKVKQGAEVVIEQDHQPVAVLRPAVVRGRKISEILALMDKNSTATMDADFPRDVQAGIDAHNEPWEPPAWD
jgi:antitoxin (DNA-binding transcriptional repressor) of toxin-antitoxin stability system